MNWSSANNDQLTVPVIRLAIIRRWDRCRSNGLGVRVGRRGGYRRQVVEVVIFEIEVSDRRFAIPKRTIHFETCFESFGNMLRRRPHAEFGITVIAGNVDRRNAPRIHSAPEFDHSFVDRLRSVISGEETIRAGMLSLI